MKDYTTMTEAELCFEIDKRESYNLMREAEVSNLKDLIRREQLAIDQLKEELRIKKTKAA